MKDRNRIDLGLAISRTKARPGERLSLAQIAAYCDCPASTILRIERRGLAKLRKAMAGEIYDMQEG